MSDWWGWLVLAGLVVVVNAAMVIVPERQRRRVRRKLYMAERQDRLERMAEWEALKPVREAQRRADLEALLRELRGTKEGT